MTAGKKMGPRERYLLVKYMEPLVEDGCVRLTDRQVSEAASESLGFPVTVTHVRTARQALDVEARYSHSYSSRKRRQRESDSMEERVAELEERVRLADMDRQRLLERVVTIERGLGLAR